MTNSPKFLIIHHTGGTDAQPNLDTSHFSFSQCNDLHRVRFDMLSSLGYYVGYHYYIERSGKLHQARADNEEGAHAKGFNTSSIGICLAGNFDSTLPTAEQVLTLKKLLNAKAQQYKIATKDILPHRNFAQKTCYGTRLSTTWAQGLINHPGAVVTPQKPKYKFTTAMGWSYTPSDSVKALQSILKYEGCLAKDFAIDGKFLEATARGLKTWQISHGITDFQLESDLKKIRAGLKTIMKLNELYSK